MKTQELGKSRSDNKFPNSRNWKEKQSVRMFLISQGYISYGEQQVILAQFRGLLKGEDIGCRLIVNNFWDLFQHYVKNTDFFNH